MNRKQRRASQKQIAAPRPLAAGKGLSSAQRLQVLKTAVAHHKAGQLMEAEAGYRQILEQQPNDSTALHHLSLIAKDRGDIDEALRLVAMALKADPRYAEAHNSEGTYHKLKKQLDEADASFRRAIQSKRNYAEAHYNRGTVLSDQDKLEEAVEQYRIALGIQPNYTLALNNLGIVLSKLLRLDEATDCFQRALRVDPTMASLYSNFGNALRRQGRYEEAMRAYACASALAPDMVDARFNYGTLELQIGNLKPGWQLYELGFTLGERRPQRHLEQPRWNGEDARGKSLLVWREQGIGDEIMFGTCIPDLVRQAGKVIVECDTRLVPLFARSIPEALVRPSDSFARSVPDADAHIPMGSLPGIFRNDIGSFPTAPGYLRADPARMAFWKKRVDALGDDIKVGLCWRSQLRSRDRDLAYADFEDVKPLFAIPGIRFVCLQYDASDEEVAEINRAHGTDLVHIDGLDQKNDIDGAAALIANLDLVISAATSVGEIAGALGIPVWRFSLEADWTRHGTTGRPWFPSMRCFNRHPDSPWRILFDKVHRELAAIAADPQALRERKTHACTWSVPLPATPPDVDTPPVLGHDEKKKPSFAMMMQQQGDKGSPALAAQIEAVQKAEQAHNHFQNGDHVAALGLYQDILAVNPIDQNALFGAANIAAATGQPEAAIALYQTLLQIEPNSVEAVNNLGSTLRKMGRHAEAIDIVREAVNRNPQEARLWHNIAATLSQRHEPGDVEHAILFYEEALRLDPTIPEPFSNYAMLLCIRGDWEKGLELHRKALELAPDNPKLQLNHAVDLLATGHIQEGWQRYEARLAQGMAQAIDYRHGLPRWQGEALAGKRILVSGEQGLGDQIFFANCLPDLIAAAQEVTVDVEPRLVPLFRRSFPDILVHASTSTGDNGRIVYTYDWLDGKHDYACPIGSLPLYFRNDLQRFPETHGYLKAAPERVAGWRDRLAALGPEPQIGICWRSGLRTPDRQRFYTELSAWGPVLTLPGLRFVNLQYDECAEELAAAARQFGIAITNFTDLDQRDDLDETAALISALDMVITAPTAVQAMAGALGVPTLLLGASWLSLGTDRFPFQPSVTPVRETPETPMLDRAAAILRERF
jgi:tetratricopeptide (TPR) repeat protein